MFHQGEPRFRAWLTAAAAALPRSPRGLVDEIRRLADGNRRLVDENRRVADQVRESRQALARSEGEHAAMATAIRELEEGRTELLAYVEALESDRRRLQDQLSRFETDRQERIEHVAELEATLEARRLEDEYWLRLLPRLRVRLPGGRAAANRLRALRRRLRGGPKEPTG